MEMESYDHGVPSWIDHSGPDPAKASEFYSALFGWDIMEGGPESGGYNLASKAGKNVAGIGPQMGGPGPSYWATYVNVDSADDVTEKVRAHGGTVLVEPMDVMAQGRMAVFADPAGAVFGIWQPGLMKGAGLVNENGTLGWNELVTSDVEGSKAFYGAVFGWGHASHEGGPPGGYTEWKVGDRTMGGMMAKPPGMPAEVPSYWGVYFVVPDVDATVAKASELGGSVFLPAFDSPQGRLAGIVDPFGAMFSVISPPGVPQQ
jgi:predicted enzyme related to lactoylglutathione lyase